MRESEGEKLQQMKCGCPTSNKDTNRTSLGGPVVNNLDESLEQIENNGTTTGTIVNTLDNRENFPRNGSLVGASMRNASLQPCDGGGQPARNSWNDKVSCPKDHSEARCLFLWNQEEKEKGVAQVKEDLEEETSSVHFFLEQLVGDEGWRECVKVKKRKNCS